MTINFTSCMVELNENQIVLTVYVEAHFSVDIDS